MPSRLRTLILLAAIAALAALPAAYAEQPIRLESLKIGDTTIYTRRSPFTVDGLDYRSLGADFITIAKQSPLIVSAKVVRTEERECQALADPARKDKVAVYVAEVEKVITGKFDSPTVVFQGSTHRPGENRPEDAQFMRMTGDETEPGPAASEKKAPDSSPPADTPYFTVGQVYILCLGPSDYKDISREITFQHLEIRVENGQVVFPPELLIAGVDEGYFKDQSLEKVEAAIQYMRGPTLVMKPVKEAFRCDEPLAFEATWTNPSPLPMRLYLAKEPSAADFYLTLLDEQGFHVLKLGLITEDDDLRGMPDKIDRIVTIAPGESLTRKVLFFIRMDDYRLDPERARVVGLSFGCHSRGFTGSKLWTGGIRLQCPIRIACPFRSWAAELQQPSGDLAVSLTVGEGGRKTAADILYRDELLVGVAYNGPDRPRAGGPSAAPGGAEPPSKETRVLEGKLLVEGLWRDNRPQPVPATRPVPLHVPAPGTAPPNEIFPAEIFNLSEYVDFRGHTFRVRLLVPTDPPCLSNVITVRVLGARPKPKPE